MAVTRKASAVENPPMAELLTTLPSGQKVKRRTQRMRACNEKDEKGKLCCGHLKRWSGFGDEFKKQFGGEAEVYRCEHCKTLYLPNQEGVRGLNVAGQGQNSIFGLTVAPKK